MPMIGDFYKVVFSVSGKAVGKTVQLVTESETDEDWWLVKSIESLETVGGTKETHLWVPLTWLQPLENYNA